MKIKLKPLDQQVMVITGASSGIGLATAQAAARRGATVVLAARTEGALDEAVSQIAQEGGQAFAVPCDVADPESVKHLAQAAIERFGRIDTWVNNAGVGILGRVVEVPDADMRQLFEINFWGQVYGSIVAAPFLEAQGGALINIGSMASDRAIPMQGVYSASKHAVKAFTDSLRMELEERQAPISVTLIKPASIGTPMPQHVRNFTGQEARFPPPVYAPEEVAAAILHAAETPRRDIFVGSSARTASSMAALAPRLLDKVSEALLFKAQIGPEPVTPGDNLDHGGSEAMVRGDHQGSWIRPSLYTRASLRPAAATVLAGVALAGVAGLVGARRAMTRAASI